MTDEIKFMLKSILDNQMESKKDHKELAAEVRALNENFMQHVADDREMQSGLVQNVAAAQGHIIETKKSIEKLVSAREESSRAKRDYGRNFRVGVICALIGVAALLCDRGCNYIGKNQAAKVEEKK